MCSSGKSAIPKALGSIEVDGLEIHLKVRLGRRECAFNQKLNVEQEGKRRTLDCKLSR